MSSGCGDFILRVMDAIMSSGCGHNLAEPFYYNYVHSHYILITSCLVCIPQEEVTLNTIYIAEYSSVHVCENE